MDITLKQDCECGVVHNFDAEIISGAGAILGLPERLQSLGVKSVFMIADVNTYTAAGERVETLLTEEGIRVAKYVFPDKALEPDERSVGLAVMKLDTTCDAVVGVGSGVINDVGKIVANVSGKKYVVVGTAPSMDGYASSTSSMTLEGVKVSVGSKCPDLIVGDTEILSSAPVKMMLSGLGDMIAKYVSVCEWRISALINGEYYCERIAELVRRALARCIDNADGLLSRKAEAVEAVFDGLVLCGMAMKAAGTSRPASGVEHYLSHIWDMRGAAFGTAVDLHGIQCAVGTLAALRIYEKLTRLVPDRDKAIRYARSFDLESWNEELKKFVGNGADAMIALEKKEKKYAVDSHAARLERIVANWDEILTLIREELPSVSDTERLYKRLGLPMTMSDIGMDDALLPMTFKASKDIRDKYVLSRLAWDLGVMEELV